MLVVVSGSNRDSIECAERFFLISFKTYPWGYTEMVRQKRLRRGLEWMKNGYICLVTLVVLGLPCLSFADEASQFSGTMSFGGVIIDSGNNLNPSGLKDRLDNLDSGAERQSSYRAMVLPRVSWDVGDPKGLTLHFITDPPMDEAGTFVLNVGASYEMDKIGIIGGEVFFTPFEEVWKNPYATDVARQESGTQKYGFKMGLERILGSGFRVQLVYLNNQVDDDLIGKLMPELARDGAVYSTGLGYSFNLSPSLIISPGLSIRKGDYEGDANSFLKYKIKLQARYMFGRMMLVPEVYYSHRDYDDTDPIFAKNRKFKGYGIKMLATYRAPFNLADWSVSSLLTMSRGEANIDFYDTESVVFAGFVNYHF